MGVAPILPTLGAVAGAAGLGSIVSSVIGGGGGGSTRAAPAPAPVTQAQERAETRAAVQTREEAARLAARRRVRKTGGLRLLMSPQRRVSSGIEAQPLGMRSTLGPGGMVQ